MILAMVTIHIIQNPRLIIACPVVTWYSIDIYKIKAGSMVR